MVLGYDDGRYIFASAICIFVHNNKTNVIVLHIYFSFLDVAFGLDLLNRETFNDGFAV